jgi:glutathione S-transferase
MRLYGHRGSICTNRALFAFAEKAVQPEFTPVDLATGQHKSPEHLVRQPFGMIPVLEDGDWLLYESRAIMRYVDCELPGPSLVPHDARSLAEMERWISVEYSYLSPSVGELVQQKFVAPARGGTVDIVIVERARQAISRALDVVDAQLQRRAYIAGEAFTLADVSFAPVIAMLFVAGEGGAVDAHDHVSVWWKRVASRPSWGRVVEGERDIGSRASGAGVACAAPRRP